MKEFLKDFLSFVRDVGSVVWHPRVVFIRYFGNADFDPYHLAHTHQMSRPERQRIRCSDSL